MQSSGAVCGDKSDIKSLGVHVLVRPFFRGGGGGGRIVTGRGDAYKWYKKRFGNEE